MFTARFSGAIIANFWELGEASYNKFGEYILESLPLQMHLLVFTYIAVFLNQSEIK